MNRAIQYREGCVSDNESRSGIKRSYRTVLKSVGGEKQASLLSAVILSFRQER